MVREEIKGLHWTKLRQMVEERGGKYEGKDEAIAFLSGDTGTETPVAAVSASAAIAADVPGDGSVADAPVTFDRSRPYGEVSGSVEEAPGARYVQGGHYFNASGEKVG